MMGMRVENPVHNLTWRSAKPRIKWENPTHLHP
jgi:hypothetical protein